MDHCGPLCPACREKSHTGTQAATRRDLSPSYLWKSFLESGFSFSVSTPPHPTPGLCPSSLGVWPHSCSVLPESYGTEMRKQIRHRSALYYLGVPNDAPMTTVVRAAWLQEQAPKAFRGCLRSPAEAESFSGWRSAAASGHRC